MNEFDLLMYKHYKAIRDNFLEENDSPIIGQAKRVANSEIIRFLTHELHRLDIKMTKEIENSLNTVPPKKKYDWE